MESLQQNLDPNHVPEEFKTPYDVIELPSQGILYKNNKKSVRLEYLTAMDESILTSPNISSGNKMIDILLRRKIKDFKGSSTKPIHKKLTIKPNENNEFEFTLPKSGKNITFTLLTGKDEEIIEVRDTEFIKRDTDNISNKMLITLEQQIKSVDGERDKLKISHLLKKLPILDTRSLRKYINEMTPGLEFKTTARTSGGRSLDTFLRFGKNFLWPEF